MSTASLGMTVVVNVEQRRRDGSRGVEAGGKAVVRLGCGHEVRCSRERAVEMMRAAGVRCPWCERRKR